MLPPEELRDAFKLSWTKVIAVLVDGVTFPSSSDPTEDQIDEAYNKSNDHLKSRVSYYFTDGRNPVN